MSTSSESFFNGFVAGVLVSCLVMIIVAGFKQYTFQQEVEDHTATMPRTERFEVSSYTKDALTIKITVYAVLTPSRENKPTVHRMVHEVVSDILFADFVTGNQADKIKLKYHIIEKLKERIPTVNSIVIELPEVK